ncbi:hypothetical protein CRV08_03550 [Halarcobacter ebronensis]|uniref:P/Homo B domain-containing protein n=1 Tax=Halarcobacter ebronensis TaxID=1462615 RepID=A0A4Q0YIW8_9BACT|nr:VCBS domain-containing protein [Halarcobacter ebronensis]RXJ69794.1 hypothetical protein CRV08_03550 [Halarcobacter ebronensis]
MFEGIKILNGQKTVDLTTLKKATNGELVLDKIKNLKIYLSNGAIVAEKVEILENNSDVKVTFTDSQGNDIFVVLKGLGEILLTNNSGTPILEVISNNDKLLSMTTIDDLEASAAGGATQSSAQTEGTGGAGNLDGTDSDDLAGRIDGPLVGALAEGEDPTGINTQPIVLDVTLDDVNEILGEEGAGNINTITGQLEVIDPDITDAGLHTFSYVEGTLSVTSFNDDGTISEIITLDDDNIELVLNPDGSFTLTGDFNDLALGESATVTFDYTATDIRGLTSEPATVTVTINGTNDIPVVEDINLNNNDTELSWSINGRSESQGYGDYGEDTKGATIDEINALLSSITVESIIEELNENGANIDLYSDYGNYGDYDVDGSALEVTLNVQAGETVTFDWIFNDLEGDGTHYNDFSFVVIDGVEVEILALVSDSGSQNSGTFSYTFDSAGEHTIVFAAINDEDDSVDSNLQVTYVSGGEIIDTKIVGYVESGSMTVFEGLDTFNETDQLSPALGVDSENGLSLYGQVFLAEESLLNRLELELFDAEEQQGENSSKVIIHIYKADGEGLISLGEEIYTSDEIDLSSENLLLENMSLNLDVGSKYAIVIESISGSYQWEYSYGDYGEGDVIDGLGMIGSEIGQGYGDEENIFEEFYKNFSVKLTYGSDGIFYESFDPTDELGVDDTKDDGLNTFVGVLSVSDDDDTDTHIFAVVEDSLQIISPENSQTSNEELPTFVINPDDVEISISFNEETGEWEYRIEGDFSALREGETATLSFQYYADDQNGQDGTDGINESSISDPATITLTITGTNDQPVVADVTYGDSTYSEEVGNSLDSNPIYESADNNPEDTNGDGILRNEDVTTTYSNTLPVVEDDDINDTHEYFLEEESSTVDNELVEEFNVVVNTNGEFTVTGDFNALAAGEKSTVSFQYYVIDDSAQEIDGETNKSELKTAYVTITGTNDQPVVENLTFGAESYTNNTEMRIPGEGDSGMITSTIYVDSVEDIEDLNVHLNLEHMWPADLDIYLIAPDGTRIELSTDNLIQGDVEFNDDYTYSYIFKPEGDLSILDGKDLTGEWTLEITDDTNNGVINMPFVGSVDMLSDYGTLFSWGLEFNSETYFESHTLDENDVVGVDDTENEALTRFSNILVATDQDVSDTHTMHILNMDSIETTEDVMNQSISYIDGITTTDDTDVTRVVTVESTDVNVADIRIDRIELSNNDDGTDSQSNFDLYGDFSALGEGETATVTFTYQAEDNSATQENGETQFSEPKTVTITITGTNDKPVVSTESYDISDEVYGSTYYETSDLDGRDNYDTNGENVDLGSYTNDDENWNTLKGKISVTDDDVNDKHHFYVVDTNGNSYGQNILSLDGDLDLTDWVTISSTAIDPSNINLASITLNNESNNILDSEYFSSQKEIEFELVGDFSNLAAGEEATVTFSYIAVDDSQQLIDGESNTSEVKTVTLTIMGTNDEPIVWSVNNGLGTIETTIANAAQQAYDNVIGAGGTQEEANAAKLEAISTQVQSNRYGEDVVVDVEVRTSYFDTISGYDDDLTDTHTLHMANTTSENTISVSTDDGQMNAAFSSDYISAEDIKDLSIDFRTLVDEQDSTSQTYSYLVTGNFSSLGFGESATIVFDYYAKDDSEIGTNGESDESDVKQITFTIWGTNDQPVITSYDSTSSIQETNQAIELPLEALQQIAYDKAYNEVMDELFDDSPYAYPSYEEGQAAFEAAQAAAIMAANIAKEAVVADDELTVYGDGLGTVYNDDVIKGYDDDINDKHALFLANLEAESAGQQELLIDFSTTNGSFSDTGSDIKAIFTTDSANVTAEDIKDVSVIFNTTSDETGSNLQEYTYQVVGNYNALGAGETATITFAYYAGDDSGSSNEESSSELHEITLTITGTNDKPVVQADSFGGNESTQGAVTTLTHTLSVSDDDNTDMVNGHIFKIQEDLSVEEVNPDNVYSIKYYNYDTNTIGWVEVEINGPLAEIDTTKITLIISGNQLTLQGEFDALAGEYTDNSETVIPAEELSLKFKYYADDQNGFDGTDGSNENSVSDSQWMTITVTGTNDVPTIETKDYPSSMDEDSHVENGMLTTFGSVEIADLDHGQDYFSTDYVSPENNIGGVFTFNADGTWDYKVDNSLAVIQALKDGEYIDQTYTIKSIDGTASYDITVRVWGTEDISIISNDSTLTGDVKEDTNVVDDVLSTTGTLYIVDPDDFPNEAAFNEAVTYSPLSDGEQLGTLTLVNENAENREYPMGETVWTYEVNNEDPRVQALGEGESIKQIFIITSADGSSSENITITINGTNDAPTISVNTEDANAQFVEMQGADTGANAVVITSSVAINDIDGDNIKSATVIIENLQEGDELIFAGYEGIFTTTYDVGVLTITAIAEAGVSPEIFEAALNSVMFNNSSDTPDTTTREITFSVTDIHDEPSNVAKEYVEVEAVNDAPISTPEADFEVYEDDEIYNGSVEAFDPESTTLTYSLVGDAPDGLVFNENGTYSFDPSHESYQSLSEGEEIEVTFQWIASDGEADSTTDSVTITVIGTNDQPSVDAVIDSVSESTTSTTTIFDGTLSAVTDADSLDTHTYSEYGIVNVSSNDVDANDLTDITVQVYGNGEYQIRGNFEALSQGDTATITFQYIVTDNSGATNAQSEAQTVTLTISGTNDTPIVNNVLLNLTENEFSNYDNDDLNPDGENSVFTSSESLMPENDSNDTYSYIIQPNSVSTTPSNIVSSPTTVEIDENGYYTITNPDFNKLAAGESVTVFFTAIVSDGTNFDTPSIMMTITGSNDKPTVTNEIISVVDEADGLQVVKTGTLNYDDVDTSDTHTFEISTQPSVVVYESDGVTVVQGVSILALEVVLNSATGEYEVKGNFDALAQGQKAVIDFGYKVTDDSGTANAQSDEGTVTLTVNGTNDAATLTYDLVSSSINETISGEVLATLNVEDLDGTVSYSGFSLSGDDASLVEIIEENGEFKLKLKDGVSLDYETNPSLDVRVTYNDGYDNSIQDINIAVNNITGIISTAGTGAGDTIINNTFNGNNNNWGIMNGSENNGNNILGWFNSDNTVAYKSFDLDAYSGENVTVSFDLSTYQYNGQWESNDYLDVWIRNGNGQIISNNSFNSNDDTTFTFEIPQNGEFTIYISSNNTANSEYWAIDNFEISATTTGEQILTLDSSTSGEINMAELLSQANDFSGNSSSINELDTINLVQGDHILSNISIGDVLAMTDSDKTLEIKGDNGDTIKLDLGASVNNASEINDNQWHQVDDTNTYIGKLGEDTVTLLINGIQVEEI